MLLLMPSRLWQSSSLEELVLLDNPRQESVWAIEQAIIMTFQLQGGYEVVSDRLTLQIIKFVKTFP